MNVPRTNARLLPTVRVVRRAFALVGATLLLSCIGDATWGAEERDDALRQGFATHVRSFLHAYCLDCHAGAEPEARLDLSVYSSLAKVAEGHRTWELVLARLEASEMPPEDATPQPTSEERRAVVAWIRDFREREAARHADDPGPVPARRLSNAEYNYTIRDLTGVDLRPAQEFPVDPANEAGFDNSGESLTMSPALLNKHLAAARRVAEHLVLKPQGFAFAPHPVATDTDRDKYCVKRIVEFYHRQPTDLADYFFAAWRLQQRSGFGEPHATLAEVAAAHCVSGKYLATVWSVLTEAGDASGPLAELRARWRALPAEAHQEQAARQGCETMRDYVLAVRKRLEPTFRNLEIEGSNKGSQPFVLWKNHQYAAHRRRFDPAVLRNPGDAKPREQLPPGLAVPVEETARAAFEAALARFCDIFPDAFYVSERGRDYVGKPKEQQEKGRLLSAGFHSMMGYFRDDAPLYELILDAAEQRELDQLWQELNFVTGAPMRQYAGFVWFERTDSRFMRDPEFDFARAEDKDVTSETKLARLAEIYLAKARRSGGDDTELQAIADYFRDINAQIRWVENARLAAQPSHLEALLDFAERAYRRRLSSAEKRDLLAFYRGLRDEEGLSHEEALQDTLVAVLLSPHFCYRVDLGSAGEGSRPLTDDELASRLSYFLWSSMPDRELLDCAAAGDLHRPEVLLAQTRRMLRDERVRGLAVEFAGQWLDIRRFEEHNSVDRERFPQFTDELRQAMFEEPIRFFLDVVQNDRSILDFLYADATWVNRPLAAHYGLSDLDLGAGEWRRVSGVGAHHRGGLLPMAVFLTKNSPGLRTSPVKRGYWVVRQLLGERIPAPPPNVPELPSDEKQLGELTLRETLARHRDHKSCAGCHDRFDSLGLTFENFGPVGEWRTVDLAGRPLDAGAAFPDGSEGAGLEGLRRYLRDQRQEDFLDNLCRKLLSYALGRTLLLSDEPLVRRMRADLPHDGFRLARLVEHIVSSPQFLNKRGRDYLVKGPSE